MLLPPFQPRNVLFSRYYGRLSANEQTFPRARTLWTFLFKDVTHAKKQKILTICSGFLHSRAIDRHLIPLFLFFFTKNVHSLCDLTSLWLEKSFFFLSNNHVLFVSFDSHNSHELQTCDWPRNVGCLTGADAVAAAKTKASSRPSNVDQKLGSPLTQFLDSE